MNYGYAWPSTAAGAPDLLEDDRPDRLCIQLYHKVASAVPLSGKDVLEVGSGRGGGCGYIARYLKPARITGIDFSANAVALSQARHTEENLSFATGDAEALPFPDGSFDAVVNVESSHCYGDVPKFFSEVARVLRPGGSFLFADLRDADEMDDLKRDLAAQSGFEIFEEEDITAQVAASLSIDHTRKLEQIERLAPPRMAKMFKEFAGLQGTQIFENLNSRSLLYFRFVVRKTSLGH